MFVSPNGTSSARWPIANDGSVPIPTSSPSSRIAFVWSAASSSSVVQRWPSRPTYWRWSVQIGHDGGGRSDSANWVPHVTQMNRSMGEPYGARRWQRIGPGRTRRPGPSGESSGGWGDYAAAGAGAGAGAGAAGPRGAGGGGGAAGGGGAGGRGGGA